jgi:hypothetical protein
MGDGGGGGTVMVLCPFVCVISAGVRVGPEARTVAPPLPPAWAPATCPFTASACRGLLPGVVQEACGRGVLGVVVARHLKHVP